MSGVQSLLRWIAIGSVFALPFIVFNVAESLFFPFITGKNFLFRGFVEIGFVAYLALALTNTAYRPKRTALLAAFSLFVAIVALADAFGAHPFKSFWSNYERMDGFITLVHLFAYFVTATAVLNTEKLWERLFQTSLGVSVVMGIHGVSQALGVATVSEGFSSASRVDASFGNPIYFAVFMLFHVGIAALLWVWSWQKRKEGSRLWISVLYGSIMVFDGLVLFLTGTRGAMLGILGGFLLGAAILAFSSRTWRWHAVTALLALLLLAGVFWSVRDAAWIQRIPPLQRLASISLEDNTTKARIMNWGTAWQGVKERPILGWGQEHFAIVFDNYYNPKMYAQEQWFDRVHNIVFDWLIAAGFLGLFSYLGLFGAAAWLLWRRDVRGGALFSPLERAIVLGMLAGYFVHTFFVFDNVSSYLLFGTVLAFVAARAGHVAVPMFSSIPVVPRVYHVPLLGAAVVFAGILWWMLNANALSQNRALIIAIAPQQGKTVEQALAQFDRALSYKSVGTQEAREQMIQMARQVVAAEGISQDTKRAFLERAASEMEKMMEESPRNARFPLFLGSLLVNTGNFSLGMPALEKALENSPRKQTILYEIGSALLAQGDNAGALKRFKEAYELAPENTEALRLYTIVAERTGEIELAESLKKKI
jgi:O-antigen ligase